MTTAVYEHLIKEFISNCTETELRGLLVDFFSSQGIAAYDIHSSSEHGMDVIARVTSDHDTLKAGYYVLIQVKAGNVGLGQFRKILLQILELPYFKITHPDFSADLPRRIVVALNGVCTAQARDSIVEYNAKHDVKLELFDLAKLVILFASDSGFSRFLLQRSETVAGSDSSASSMESPPQLGED